MQPIPLIAFSSKGDRSNRPNGNGSNLEFEQTLWAATDKMRCHMDSGEI